MTSARLEPDVESSIWIARPPEDIWEYIYDVSNDAQWREGVISGKWISDPPHGVGSTGLNIVEGIGDWPWKVTELEKPRAASWVITNGRLEGAHAGYRIAPEDAGSRMTLYIRVKRSALMRIFMLIMKRRIRRQFDGDVERLKAIMES
jgi:uncharacterized membrane protein